MIRIAKVLSNKDPLAQERLKVNVMGVHNIYLTDDNDTGIWAHHCSPIKYSSGSLPIYGDMVYVWFDEKMPNDAIWMGHVISSNSVETDNTKETIKTNSEILDNHKEI